VSTKPLVSRAVAERDTTEAVDYYTDEVDPVTALKFIGALELAKAEIGQSPQLGSPRYADLLRMPGLRNRKLRHFPYLIFYFERDDHVDVWRVLHSARDLPTWLASADD
jgi:toxin ParE1/3/4